MSKIAPTKKLPRASTVWIIDDEAERWVANRKEISEWLRRHGHLIGRDPNTNLAPTVRLSAEKYEDLCNSVSYYGRYDHLTLEQIGVLEDRGAVTLYIR